MFYTVLRHNSSSYVSSTYPSNRKKFETPRGFQIHFLTITKEPDWFAEDYQCDCDGKRTQIRFSQQRSRVSGVIVGCN